MNSIRGDKKTRRLSPTGMFGKYQHSYKVVKSYLDEMSTVTRKAAFEPQKRDDITNTITLFNNGRHWHTSIAWFFTCKLDQKISLQNHHLRQLPLLSLINNTRAKEPLSSDIVEIIWVGARTLPLLIAVLRSSGIWGGLISFTGAILHSSTYENRKILRMPTHGALGNSNQTPFGFF